MWKMGENVPNKSYKYGMTWTCQANPAKIDQCTVSQYSKATCGFFCNIEGASCGEPQTKESAINNTNCNFDNFNENNNNTIKYVKFCKIV